jgi:hypothetical protein
MLNIRLGARALGSGAPGAGVFGSGLPGARALRDGALGARAGAASRCSPSSTNRMRLRRRSTPEELELHRDPAPPPTQ